MQTQVQKIIDDDFVNNFQKSINSRDRWNYLNRSLDLFAHLSSGISIILVLSLLAGGFGVGMAISNQYSSYCKTQYQNQSTVIEEMAKKVNANDELVDESATMNNDPPNSPVVHPA